MTGDEVREINTEAFREAGALKAAAAARSAEAAALIAEADQLYERGLHGRSWERRMVAIRLTGEAAALHTEAAHVHMAAAVVLSMPDTVPAEWL